MWARVLSCQHYPAKCPFHYCSHPFLYTLQPNAEATNLWKTPPNPSTCVVSPGFELADNSTPLLACLSCSSSWCRGSLGSEVKVSACNAGDLGSIRGSGRSPGEGNGNPLQYSCLENPMDGGAWWATVHGVSDSRTRLSDFTFSWWRYLHITSPLLGRKEGKKKKEKGGREEE